MGETKTKSDWSSAAKDGLLLAISTIAFLLIIALLRERQIIGAVVDICKIAGCIILLRFFMARWKREGNSEKLFGYGVKVCLFSSLVCAIFAFFEYTYIFPDLVTEAFDQVYESISSMSLPSESLDMIGSIEDNYSQWMCVSTFISDFVIGIIFSAIISSSLKRNDDIFAEKKDEIEW